MEKFNGIQLKPPILQKKKEKLLIKQRKEQRMILREDWFLI